MKPIYTLALLLASPLLYAETRFISDELYVPLRASPCERCAILHQGLKSGTPLETLDEQEEWVLVRTLDGLEGWLRGQYLVAQQVAKVRITSVEEQLASAQQKNRELSSQLTQSRQSAEQLENQLQTLSTQNRTIDSELRKVRQVSAKALNLEQQNRELLKRNGILQSEVNVLTAAKERLEREDSQTWFLYGTTAVVLGALLTALLPYLKLRRKGFSEWA